MNIYMTSGTFDFLKKIQDKHSNERMILMQNIENAVLMHETVGSTLFNAPRTYEILDSAGSFEKAKYAVMNNIPVIEEERPLFEFRFKNKNHFFENQPGFLGLRVLRPLKSSTYVILSFWENEKSYKNWQNTTAYEKYFSEINNTAFKQEQLFLGSSYVSTYYIPDESNPSWESTE
ncbi:antibiotic biosynthesis monooxygenase [Bacillus sp. FJAT-29790]|uniref:antibiotic biosynthesis monooxygenase family protein n=1 Tax=Bacillus sp. FJAT-29790 TaxID=1895002 RepID=UPI001C2425C4|nr:antibiotic biosynthesis monooxygenase [Bacillus sp. FJAT-29790]MBU8877370.1 antibiotic biosynthesis monooxygenase [Bacillus sp. FJAT-29790]